MNDEHEGASKFKVVDRRRINELGESLDNSEQDFKTKERNDDNKASSDKNKPEPKKQFERPTLNFSMFIQSLAHQAMMGLGLTPWPDSSLIKQDLVMAKETIDIIKLVKEKTLNNLDQKEQALLDTLLYQLQVAFVDANNKPTASSLVS